MLSQIELMEQIFFLNLNFVLFARRCIYCIFLNAELVQPDLNGAFFAGTKRSKILLSQMELMELIFFLNLNFVLFAP